MTSNSKSLLPSQRRELLLTALREQGALRIDDLAEEFGVTAVTMRRDVAQLASEGLLERVHGGVKLPRAEEGQHHTFPAGPSQPDDAGPSVSSRAARGSLTIGMVVPSLDYYWPQVIQGAQAAAPSADARIVLRGSSYELSEMRRQIEGLIQPGGVHGLLVAPATAQPGAEELLRWLLSLEIPVVLVERTGTAGPPYHEHIESVSTDHAFGASLAVRHLAATGVQRIGFVAAAGSPTTAAIHHGWHTTCSELGLPVEGTPDAATASHDDPEWPDQLDDVLDQCQASGTDGLLVHSDPEAISLVAACEARGIRVPEDLAVVAYDDEVASLTNPPLTAVRPPRHELGRAAVELLSQQLRGGRARPIHRIQLSPRLVARQSTAPAAGLQRGDAVDPAVVAGEPAEVG